uniref:Uncharacterized protein n=1 Tax=Anopheles farauti TaxID=69004 RepID=A0A182Q2T0_9DIPT
MKSQRGGRKSDAGIPSAITPLTKLLDGLRCLSSEMCFGSWAGKSGPDFPFHLLAQRVRSLVGEFQGFGTAPSLLTPAERTEGWRQVVRFLVLLQTIGPTGGGPSSRRCADDPGCDKHRHEDDKQSIADVSRAHGNHKPKCK